MTPPARAKVVNLTQSGTGFDRMKANLGPAKAEELRQHVIADQTKAQTEVAKPLKAKPTKADIRKITVLANSNPHASGSRRARWFNQLKTGMAVEDAIKAGVRSIYLQRMAARKIILVGVAAVPAQLDRAAVS
jgi:hypothetical protein